MLYNICAFKISSLIQLRKQPKHKIREICELRIHEFYQLFEVGIR